MKICSKHKDVGNPDCNECWAILGDYFREHNITIIADKKTKKRLET